MRWWPRKIKPRRPAPSPPPGSFLPAPPVPSSTQASPQPAESPAAPPFERPDNVIGLLSDVTRNPSQARTLVVVVGAILGIVTGCVALLFGSFAIVVAAKGAKGVPLGAILSVGIPGASAVAFAVSRLLRRIFRRLVRKLTKGDPAGPCADGTPNTRP